MWQLGVNYKPWSELDVSSKQARWEVDLHDGGELPTTLGASAATFVCVVPEGMKPLLIPLSTYRLQFNRNFTFSQAAELVPYLAKLGISHCYASPYLRARPGSMHGYDIVNHHQINPEIGTLEDYDKFVAALHQHGMGQILDIVPNHMGIMGTDNTWWLDVLENGEASAYAEFFDIDWYPLKDELLELQSLISAFNHLPGQEETDPEKRAERLRDKEIHKRRLAALCARSSEIGQFLVQVVERINGNGGDPASFDALHELIKTPA